ncbi:methyltransferase-like protein 25B isoform X2 [Ambystoma mexicanum]
MIDCEKWPDSIQSFPLEQQKKLASNITHVLSIYGFITDSYIIEFFTDGLWKKLPPLWQMALNDLPSPMLAALLMYQEQTKSIRWRPNRDPQDRLCLVEGWFGYRTGIGRCQQNGPPGREANSSTEQHDLIPERYRSVWPLSLLALKVTAQVLAYPRTPKHNSCDESKTWQKEFRDTHCQSSMLNPIFRKHVKPKKQHEIRQLGKLVKKLSEFTGCEHVVDIGSGQGHLSRFLSFGLGLGLTAVEADEHLVRMAAKFDQQLLDILQKDKERGAKIPHDADSSQSSVLRAPRHVLAWVNPRASWEEFTHLFQTCDCPSSGTSISKITNTDRRWINGVWHGIPEDSFHVGLAENVLTVDAESSNVKDIIKENGRKNHAENHSDTKTKAERLTYMKEMGNTFENTYRKSENNTCMTNSESGTDKKVDSRTFCHCCPPQKVPGRSPVNTLSPHDDHFILTGLHACGDLSVAMLRHFVRCPNVVGITSVGCCYMKLTTQEMPSPPGVVLPPLPPTAVQHTEFGYPVSTWVAQLPGHKLSYKSREVSCHAIEDYCCRLESESAALGSHCFRAVLETIIRDINPSMKRVGVQTIKKAHSLSFEEYARLGLKRLGLTTNVHLDTASIKSMLIQRQNVVAYFSLALLLAPLVETLLLLDRMIFLNEQGLHCELVPLFDPKLSPRNLVLVAAKPKLEQAETTVPNPRCQHSKASDL